jgi:hypothetical protein
MGAPIYVNTDNSNPKKKLFNASAVSNAAAVEKKMQEVVVETIRDDAGADFNTDKPGKGYSLRMKVVAEKDGRATTYSVTIEILRYPPEAAKGGKGEAMVPITVKLGRATLEGASEADLLDAIAQLTKKNVKAAIGPMTIDMTRR